MPPSPSVASGQLFLLLDDQPALIQSADGGNIKGEVVTVNLGPEQLAMKHISRLTFEPFSIGVGLAMGKPLAEWIKACLDLSPTRKHGSVVAAKADKKVHFYRTFHNALIESITVPAMDGASKDAAFFTITFQPEEIIYAKPDDAVIGSVNPKQKKWLRSNFRLRVGNLPCDRVTKIDAFTIKQTIVEHRDGGDRRGHRLAPTHLEYPNLKVTFSAADVGPWQEWFTEFVISGHNGQDRELAGALEFLDTTSKEVLGSVELSQVGIFALYAEKHESNKDAIARYVAELYVERMVIKLKNV